MKSKILIYSLLLVLLSCNTHNSETSENALLADEVKVTYVEDLVPTTKPSEWLYGLDRGKLFDLVFKQVIEHDQTVYITDKFFFIDEPVSKEEVVEALQRGDTIQVMDQMQAILFNETWQSPADYKSFSKKIIAWCPIRVWTRPGTDEIFKRMEFYVKATADIQGEVIASSVFYEFTAARTNGFTPIISGLDMNSYIRKVLENVQAGEIVAYDPIYLVDKTVKQISPDELSSLAGMDLKSEEFLNQIESLIFEENWYFDAGTMSLQKEILSLGFVRKYYEDGDNKSKILFFLRFG